MTKRILVLFFLISAGCANKPKTAASANDFWSLWGQVGAAEQIAGATIVKVNFGGKIARMVIDEKSDTSAITPELKIRLNLGLVRVAEATIEENKKVWLDVVKLENFEVASRKYTLTPVLVLDINKANPYYGPVDGILGLDFIKTYNLSLSRN